MIRPPAWIWAKPTTGGSMRSTRPPTTRSSKATSGALRSSRIPIAITGITATASSVHATGTGPEKTIDGSGLDRQRQAFDHFDRHVAQHKNRRRSPPGSSTISRGRTSWTRCSSGTPTRRWREQSASGPKTSRSSTPVDAQSWTALGDFEFVQASGEGPCAADTVVDFAGVPAKYVKLTINSNWDGMVKQYGLSEVRFLYVPVAAREPSPADDANDVHPQVTLSWRAGREAATHQVYLGTDANNLPRTLAPATVATASYEVAADLVKTYYWQVVEVNEAEQPTTWPSDVWSFSTADVCRRRRLRELHQRLAQEASSRPGSMAQASPPMTSSRTAVQATTAALWSAMILRPATSWRPVSSMAASNRCPCTMTTAGAPRYSETERTFTPPQDWTKHGITTLVVFFRGDAANTSAPVYVKINGTKVVYNGGAPSTAFPSGSNGTSISLPWPA